MSATVMRKRIADASPRFMARIAGVLYLFSLLMAAFTELFVRGRLNIAGGLIAIAGMVIVTLLVYDLFKPVNRSRSLLAVSLSFVGLIFEVLRWQPQGVNAAIVFVGFNCLLIGYLIFRSTFVRKLSVPPQSGLRPPRARIADAVAPRDGRKRSTMEGAGECSGVLAIVARHAALIH